MEPDEVEAYRAECEARDWLRRGYDTPEKIAELKFKITAKRGKQAADRLVEEMRRQWKRQDEWMEGAND